MDEEKDVTRLRELRLTDSYSKTKRAYMFSVCFTILFLSASHGTDVKVPGFGDDIKLPALWGHVACFLATIFFAWEYFADYLSAKMRNSELLYKVADSFYEETLQQRAAQVLSVKNEMENVLSNMQGLAEDIEKYRLDLSNISEGRMEWLNKAVSEEVLDPILGEPVTVSTNEDLALQQKINSIRYRVRADVATKMSDIQSQFIKTGDMVIHKIERISIQIKDYDINVINAINLSNSLSRSLYSISRDVARHRITAFCI